MTLRLNGSTSGYVELDAPAVAGTTALTLPATAGTVATQAYADTAGGLQLITTQSFSAVSSISINNCFTSTYQNYRIQFFATASTPLDVGFRLRASGSDETGNNINRELISGLASTVASLEETNQNGFYNMFRSDTNGGSGFADIFRPAEAAQTFFTCLGGRSSAIQISQGRHSLANSYDGFTLFPNTGNMTGTVRVYGYKNGA